MWSAGSSQLNAATEKFNDSSIFTDTPGRANDLKHSGYSLATKTSRNQSFPCVIISSWLYSVSVPKNKRHEG